MDTATLATILSSPELSAGIVADACTRRGVEIAIALECALAEVDDAEAAVQLQVLVCGLCRRNGCRACSSAGLGEPECLRRPDCRQ